MSDQDNSRQVSAFRLTRLVAEKRIRSLAAKSDNIAWGLHALDRMVERDILDVDALRILRKGQCVEDPVLTPRGEWKTKLVLRIRGVREAGVAVVILRSNRLFVKTVEWKDIK